MAPACYRDSVELQLHVFRTFFIQISLMFTEMIDYVIHDIVIVFVLISVTAHGLRLFQTSLQIT